jgi:hypothetical protein
VGHFDPFPQRRLNDRCVIGKETVADAAATGGNAPMNEPARGRGARVAVWRNFAEVMRGSA